MASVLRVALLQIASSGPDQAANREKGLDWCRDAAGQGADIALLPEMWNIGYTGFVAGSTSAAAAWKEQAISEESAFVTAYRDLARDRRIAIALPYLLRNPAGDPSNAVSLIDRDGAIRFTYSKVHTCCYEVPEVACAPGTEFHVSEIETSAGPVKVGAMICYDREFPESARLLMLKGAEVVLAPNACSMREFDGIRLHQFRARAFENMVAAAVANYPAPQHDGHSMACGPDGSVLLEAPETEGMHIAGFDLDRLRAWRATAYWGDAFRRPSVYGPIASPAVAPPFIRTDMLGGDLGDRRRV